MHSLALHAPLFKNSGSAPVSLCISFFSFLFFLRVKELRSAKEVNIFLNVKQNHFQLNKTCLIFHVKRTKDITILSTFPYTV